MENAGIRLNAPKSGVDHPKPGIEPGFPGVDPQIPGIGRIFPGITIPGLNCSRYGKGMAVSWGMKEQLAFIFALSAAALIGAVSFSLLGNPEVHAEEPQTPEVAVVQPDQITRAEVEVMIRDAVGEERKRAHGITMQSMENIDANSDHIGEILDILREGADRRLRELTIAPRP